MSSAGVLFFSARERENELATYGARSCGQRLNQ